MAAPGTSTQMLAFTSTETTVVPKTRVGAHSQQVARYLSEDLQALMRQTSIDLARWLQIPPNEYPSDALFLAELLCNDLEQMLHDRLITGVHVLLCENRLDPRRGGYRVGYHAEYRMQFSALLLKEEALNQYCGRPQFPADVASWERFALLIDWDPQASPQEIEQVRRPRYLFDWVPADDCYDTNSLVQYGGGGLGTVVVRLRSAVPRSVPDQAP